MYFYFSSDEPAAVKFNGIYFGIITDTVKSCRFEQDKPPFVEVVRLNAENSAPLAFVPDAGFLSSPPEGISVTDLCGGYLFKFSSLPKKSGFNVIAQEKYRDLIATVFNENGVKISLETPSDFYAETPDFPISSATFYRFSLNGEELFAILTEGGKKVLSVYSFGGKITRLFCREICSFSVENGFSTTETYADIAKHSVTVFWNLNGGALVEDKREISRSENFCADNLPENLLPYAFCEEFLCGGDCGAYLGGSVKENADKLRGYLGEFIGVIPPPRFRAENEVGLIYSKGNNLYKTQYYVFNVENGKIVNIKKSD